MAIYRTGQASMDAQGYITGYDTKWREQLTLIRPGATIFFLTQPLQAAVITEVISDTSIRAITTGGAVVQKTNYLILLHDSLTVDGLAQDVAETLRYYQSKETVIEEAIEFFKNFDIDNLKQLVEQVKQGAESAKQSAQAAKTSETNAVNARNDAEQFKNAAKTSQDASANSATAAKGSQDAAKASEDKAKQYADSIQPGNFLVKSRDLDDVSNKKTARRNLQVYYQSYLNLDQKNLNEITGEFEGFYFQNLTANARPELGYPVTAAGSLMVVKNFANGESGCHQIYRPHNTQLYFYVRWYDPARKTWSTWSAFYSQEATDTYRTRIGLGNKNNPQFANLNLAVNNSNPAAATGVISAYLNDDSGQKRLGYRLYGEIRGDNKEWITLHVSNADSSINKYAGFNIEGDFVIPGNFKGNVLSVSDVNATKRNLSIDRVDQKTGETDITNHAKTAQIFITDNKNWGAYDVENGRHIALPVNQGGTGALNHDDARRNLKLSNGDNVTFRSVSTAGRSDGPNAFVAEGWGYTSAASYISITKSSDGSTVLAQAEFRSDANGNVSIINRDPTGGSNSSFYAFRRDGYAEFPRLNVHASAANPLLIDSANPTIEFKDTDTNARFFIVADNVSFRANVDSTGGGRIWEYNKGTGQLTLARLTDLNVENSGYAGFQAKTSGTTAVGCLRRFEVTPGGDFYLVTRPFDGTTGQYIINFPKSGGTIALQGTSDINYKENVKSYDGMQSIENIKKMELVTFNFKDDERKRNRRGVIAQQIEEIDEAYVKHTFEECGDDILNDEGVKIGNTKKRERLVLDSNVLLLDLICATKVLINESEESKKKIETLEKEVAELKAAVSALINKPTTLES